MQAKLNITESMIDAVQLQIQSNIKAALDAVAAYRNDPTNVLQEPQSYFIHDQAINLKCPAVYLLADDVDFQNEKGQNFIDAKQQLQVSIVFEAKDMDHCVRGLYRYVDAMFNVLDHWGIESADERSKNVLILSHVSYSGLQNKSDQQQNIFRKEAMMMFNVNHWQKLND